MVDMNEFRILPLTVTVQEVVTWCQERVKLELSLENIAAIEKAHNFLHDKIHRSTEPIYGVNTGFGSLCDTVIDSSELRSLQENLLKSHACGMGGEVPAEIVRIMLVLKALSLSKGHSGVQLQTVKKLLGFYNSDVLPVVYEQGSLGASGDLAPLAHLALPLIGVGEVYAKHQKQSAAYLLDPDYALQAKEGLALINGTQFMSAYGAYCTEMGMRLLTLANHIAAMSAEAFDCRIEPFMPQSHQIRNQLGQKEVAASMYSLLAGSEMQGKPKKHVQDPYSFRCIPQVHGASLDVLKQVERIIANEINAVTDNPNIFPDDDLIISAGNFHGQVLAIHLDYLAIGLAELANISERRIYKLVSGERGLPAFLTPNPGLNSGFMIAQYTAASIVSQNKQLCTPASVDSIVSSNGQEDHVSMGANAATKCLSVLNNTISVLSIEMLTAAQAYEMRRPLKGNPEVEQMFATIREQVAFIQKDVYLRDEMVKSASILAKMLRQ
ncbi:MAG: histidine ammonia-lyase [Bacteroidia bacterium]